MLISLFFLVTGIVQPFISCFAVDSSKRIYIGSTGVIEVYDRETIVDKISPQTSRSYYFTINPDDTLFICTADRAYMATLDGNIMETYDDINLSTNWELQYKGKKFTSVDGDEYAVRSNLGYSKIIKNGEETVYRISPISFIVKVLLYLSIIFTIYVTITVFVCKVRKCYIR